MKKEITNRFSQTKIVFHGQHLPEPDMTLAGYVALIDAYDLKVPLPEPCAVISQKHKRYDTEGWSVFTPRHKPADTLAGHLTFALRHEALDLAVLKTLFQAVKPHDIEKILKAEPTGKHSRRLWFLYEWLMDKKLNLRDTEVTNFVDVLDADAQYPGLSTPSKRHRVRNNLPGVKDFCPLIRRTKTLEKMMALHLDKKVRQAIGKIHPDVLARAAAFLLLKDSKASYAIEGERPPHNRVERWGRAIGQAGRQKLTLQELVRLQDIVIEDKRFTKMGWRKAGGFVGVHDRATNAPVPDHISARWQDIALLINGLIEANDRLLKSDYDPVIMAALIAFGFVFIHPFEDGNGRLHRYLIHHVLAEKEFAPKGIAFPVSAIILERIDGYRKVLENYSAPRLPLIEWKPTSSGNVKVLNETIDLYRYFDATRQAEFLYDCVFQTVDKSLPEEVAYLAGHDKMKAFIEDHFDMPDRMTELLIGFLRQNGGKLSTRARKKEFHDLTDKEIQMLEEKFAETFGL
ncbi:MAG: Fic family protein [Nitrospirae bacterium]|nr:Fic family protein [Nitrospirota bacterium]